MFQLTKLLGFRPRQTVGDSPGQPAVRLLAITANDRFYADLVDIASSCGWEIRRAGTLKEALDAIRAFSMPLVLLDAEEDGHDWRGSLPRLVSASSHPCVLVASRFADENMRQEVLRFHGYDVLPKSADRDGIIRTIQFAWFWTTRSQRFSGLIKPNGGRE